MQLTEQASVRAVVQSNGSKTSEVLIRWTNLQAAWYGSLLMKKNIPFFVKKISFCKSF